MIDISYDLSQATLYDSTNPYIRFSDLLPVHHPAGLLPKNAEYTPLVHATRLGKVLGMPSLYLKDEASNVTGSTKDRMAAVSLAYLWEQGVREFCTSSTGNSSSSYAYMIARHPDMHLHLFTAENFLPRVSFANSPQVSHFCLRDATFVEAFNYAAIHAREHGLVSERGFFNVGRREGLKLAFLEACEQVPEPIDWYVQATSSAMGVFGTFKGARELFEMGNINQLPRLLCVQQESCAPMVHAHNNNSDRILEEHIVKRPSGIAEAILRGDPTRVYPYVRNIVTASNGGFTMVSEAEIREARRLAEDMEGLSPCFSAATSLAGIIKLVRNDDFPAKDTVLVNLTGRDRAPADNTAHVHWLHREGVRWLPD
jgi:threonine synthase